MEMVSDVLSSLLLTTGSLLVVITGVALLRLPDYFSRVHGASIGDTAGAAFILLGLALQAGFTLISLKLVLIVVFLVLTGPVAAYSLAKSAITYGVTPGDVTMAEDLPEKESPPGTD